MTKNTFLSFCFLIFSETIAIAHGIHVESSFLYPQAKVKFYFSKSTPVANANVSVYYYDTDELNISGTTDKNGEFVFIPNNPGKWTLKIDDRKGHRKTTVITIENHFFKSDTLIQTIAEKHTHSDDCSHDHKHEHIHDHAHIPMFYKIIFVLALIFGITGVWYGLKARKK